MQTHVVVLDDQVGTFHTPEGSVRCLVQASGHGEEELPATALRVLVQLTGMCVLGQVEGDIVASSFSEDDLGRLERSGYLKRFDDGGIELT